MNDRFEQIMTTNHTRSATEAIGGLATGTGGRLTLDDLNDHRKVGIKGPGAIDWLRTQVDRVPDDVYGLVRSGDGSILVRVGGDEIIIESPASGELVNRIESTIEESPSGVYRVEQQGASLRLGGPDTALVWKQTCGVDVTAEPADRILYTRVAGVACGIIPENLAGKRSYRLWVDYSYAPALYKCLVDIGESL